MFVIEDEIHAEQLGEFASFDEALAELRLRASLRWDQPPNAAPCMSWQTCGREYIVIEYNASRSPWEELRRVPALSISSAGVRWSESLAVLG